MPPTGHRQNPSSPSVPPSILQAFKGVPVSIISDVMDRLYGTRGLRPYHRSGRLIGTATTAFDRGVADMGTEKSAS